MAENSTDVLMRHISDVILAEKHSETQLRSYADETVDDSEVQMLFLGHADETYVQRQRLTDRLQELGGEAPSLTGASGRTFDWVPQTTSSKQRPEERIVQNLIAAFSMERGECALYESLRQAARVAGDRETEALALRIQAEESSASERVWHFLPSRSKIAYNISTVGEVDPSVETKTGEDQILLDS